MREPQPYILREDQKKLLLGQNVTPRRRGALRLLPALCGMVGGLIGFALAPWPLHSAPSWPPAGVTFVPAIPRPQGHLTAYVETDQNFLVQVTFEPVDGLEPSFCPWTAGGSVERSSFDLQEKRHVCSRNEVSGTHQYPGKPRVRSLRHAPRHGLLPAGVERLGSSPAGGRQGAHEGMAGTGRGSREAPQPGALALRRAQRRQGLCLRLRREYRLSHADSLQRRTGAAPTGGALPAARSAFPRPEQERP